MVDATTAQGQDRDVLKLDATKSEYKKATIAKITNSKDKPLMSWFIYMIEVSDGSYYTGISNDVSRRISIHQKGLGSKYVRSRLPVKRVVYLEPAKNKSAALKREYAIKRLSRKKKEELICNIRANIAEEVLRISTTISSQ